LERGEIQKTVPHAVGLQWEGENLSLSLLSKVP
jgi:hypothetical protein